MSRTGFSCVKSVASESAALIATNTTQPASDIQSLGPRMTTYYHYGENGHVYASTKQPESLHIQEDVVGAYLAQRTRPHPTYTGLEACQSEASIPGTYAEQSEDHISHGGSEQGWLGGNYDSYVCMSRSLPDSASTIGYAGWATYSNQDRPYPDPEHIRHLHSLHGLLPYLQPERKLNSLNGPTMDIVAQDTNTVLAHAVPKKLLVLFLGRRVVTKFIKTVKREDMKNWSGHAVCQILSLPHGLTSRVAVRILVSWMTQACQYHTMGVMPSIQIPTNIFAACSLAQTMSLFGLHRDALRLDTTISQQHFQRPIHAAELESLWKCMGQDNRYVYAAIKAVGKRVRAYDTRNTKYSHQANQMFALLNKYPEIDARVRDLELNEQHRPEFGVQWMQDLENHPSSSVVNSFDARQPYRRHTGSNEVYQHTEPGQAEDTERLNNIHLCEQPPQCLQTAAQSGQDVNPQGVW